jgi:hypothetical protein
LLFKQLRNICAALPFEELVEPDICRVCEGWAQSQVPDQAVDRAVRERLLDQEGMVGDVQLLGRLIAQEVVCADAEMAGADERQLDDVVWGSRGRNWVCGRFQMATC